MESSPHHSLAWCCVTNNFPDPHFLSCKVGAAVPCLEVLRVDNRRAQGKSNQAHDRFSESCQALDFTVNFCGCFKRWALGPQPSQGPRPKAQSRLHVASGGRPSEEHRPGLDWTGGGPMVRVALRPLSASIFPCTKKPHVLRRCIAGNGS